MNYKLVRLDVNGLTSKGLTGGRPAQGELEGEGNWHSTEFEDDHHYAMQ